MSLPAKKRPASAVASSAPDGRAAATKRQRLSAAAAAAGATAAKLSKRHLTAQDLSDGGTFDGCLDERGSVLRYDPGFASKKEASSWLQDLRDGLSWEQGSIKLFGKVHPEPRLTCYYGDKGLEYTYTGRTVRPRPWTECRALERIRQRIEKATGETFNTVLCNRYRSGDDAMGWHADDEAVYGPTPTIASLSLGAERDFDVRKRCGAGSGGEAGDRLRITLRSGSLLVMSGTMQQFWHHCVPRRKRISEERINLTFRKILKS